MRYDTSLRRFASTLPHGQGVVIGALNPAYRAGNTIFPSRVFAPGEVRRVLKDGHQSRKIGRIVTKGQRKGWPIFTLTLEERATCPRTCLEWGTCYGNNMQAAERIEAGPELIKALALELAELAAAHPSGFMVRLHVLGDFYSVEYVEFWRAALRAIPPLHVFGFTARSRASDIGQRVMQMIDESGWSRAAIRFSGAEGVHGSARVLDMGEDDKEAVLCPAQTGATECCATCALCWHSQRTISFLRH